LGTDLKKIFILEDEYIVAFDIKNILVKIGSYLPIIIKRKEDILSLVLKERPGLIIVSSSMGKELSNEIFSAGEKFNTKFILLSTNSQYEWNQKTDVNFYSEVIFKPFINEILINSVENILKPSSPVFASQVNL
jgi:two-component SAPR family response regulator